MKNNLLLILSLLVLLLGGCSNSIFEKNTTITSIEILKFESTSPSPEEYSEQEGDVISVIKSKDEIKRIINTIERAEQESTESMNIALPNHLFIFKENENVILTLGYYPNISNGNDEFLDLDKDKIYKTNALNLIKN
ncbi:hypothetical protein [Lysinibacillus xylanilyticus]|uniref:hypothetical protein n=1 Tax=Lysinibacillus xylanilyticus TaxID=582475 RepID=UPI0036DB00DD